MVILDYRPQHLLRTRSKIIRWFRRTRIQSRKAGVLVDRPNALLKLSVSNQSVGAKNPIGLPIIELAVLRLLASDHGQTYINVAQVPSHRLSKPSCDAGRDHRAPSSTDRAAANSKAKAAHPRSGRSLSLGLALTL